MKKSLIQSVFFVLICMLSAVSFLYLQSEKESNQNLTTAPQAVIEELGVDKESEKSILPDAMFLKNIVKKGKKYITISI